MDPLYDPAGSGLDAGLPDRLRKNAEIKRRFAQMDYALDLDRAADLLDDYYLLVEELLEEPHP